MIVARLSLTDFRNYETADIELRPGPNLLVGSNGQGKTNLVEAIGYLATLSSHRVAGDQALIRAGADHAVIRALLTHAGRSVIAELQLNRTGANRAQLNRTAAKPRELARSVASVLFAPEDLALVRADPAGRRRFVDQLLVQTTPRLAAVIADYERVVRQRNGLLKSARGLRVGAASLSTLDIWDERLTELGSELIVERTRMVATLRPHVETAYRRIAGEEHRVELGVRLSILGAQPEEDDGGMTGTTADADDRGRVRESFAAAVAAARRSEFERGITLVGPHRDDLLISLNDLPARGYASHGESWSLALALKLAAGEVLRAESPVGDPVLVLDDVFAELDESRRSRLSEAVRDYEQVIVTAAVLDDVPPELRGNMFRVRAGRIEEAAG